jgi:hypothetical protein
MGMSVSRHHIFAWLRILPFPNDEHEIAWQKLRINQDVFDGQDSLNASHCLFIIWRKVVSDAIVEEVLNGASQRLQDKNIKVFLEEGQYLC